VPNLISLICTCRSGTRSDKFVAAVTLAELAQSPKCRAEVLSAGALKALVNLYTSANEMLFTEVEYQAAWAIALLVPGVDNSSELFRCCHGVLNALKLLLNRAEMTEVAGEDIGQLEVTSVGEGGSLPVGSKEDRGKRLHVVALALTHLAVLLQNEWKASAIPQHNPRGRSASISTWGKGSTSLPSDADKPLDLLVSLVLQVASAIGVLGGHHRGSVSARSLGRGDEVVEESISRGNSGTGDAISIDSIAQVESGMETMLSVASSISQLAQSEGSRVQLVSRGVLPLLVTWLCSGAKELQRYAASTVASLCCRPDQRTDVPWPDFTESTSGTGGTILDVYTSGWIDAKILAQNVVTHLLPLAGSDEVDVRCHVARALANLSIHPQNRNPIKQASGISSLVLLLNQAVGDLEGQREIAQNALSALYHMSIEDSEGDKGDSMEPSACYLIAKEGGLYPLVAFLSKPRSFLRLTAILTVAMMSDQAPVRLAVFQAGALEHLLKIGSSIEPSVAVPSSENAAAPGQMPGRREDLMMASEEALRVAVTLANLAHTADRDHVYEKRMIAANTVPVLLYLCHCRHPEVVHQAVRGLAQLCPSLVRGFVIEKTMVPGEKATDQPMRGWGPEVEKFRPLRTVEEIQEEQLRLYQANETLRMFLSLLGGPNLLVHIEAVRGISLLAKVEDFRVSIVKTALKDLLRFALDLGGDAELCQLAQEALINLGFEGGAKDLEYCGNDYSLLMDWFDMERSLEDQRVALREVPVALEAIMATVDESTLSSLNAEHRLTANIPIQQALVLGEGGHSHHRGRTAPVSTSASRGLTGAAVKEAVRIRDLLVGTLQQVNCLTPSLDRELEDEEYRIVTAGVDVPSATVIPASPPVQMGPRHQQRHSTGSTRDTIFSLLGCAREQSGGGDDEEDRFWPFAERASDMSDSGSGTGGMAWRKGQGGRASGGGGTMGVVPLPSSAGAAATAYPHPQAGFAYASIPEVGCLTFSVQRMMDRYFPSRLQQREIVPLTRYRGLPGMPPSADLPTEKEPDYRALMMPSRRFFSFRREGRVIARILKKHGDESDYWALCFHESLFEGEFCQILLERLHLLPKIKSLVFSSRQDYAETSLAYLVGNLPCSIRHVTFDGTLSRDALQILGVVLRTKTYQLQPAAALALTGLAVRNHTHLRPDDFMPLLDFIRKDNTERSSAAAPSETGLDDDADDGSRDQERVGIAKGSSGDLFPPARQSSLASQYRGMRWLDLSGNKLGDWGCAEVVKAIRHCLSLESLDLSGNAIKTGTLLLDALIAANGLIHR
jgi:hypothetical protein